MSGDVGTSGCREALLDEVGHQPLGPLLVLGQHLMGAADLVTFQAVEERDAHHGRCKKQTPGQGKERDSSLAHRDQCPGLKGRGRQWLLIENTKKLTGPHYPVLSLSLPAFVPRDSQANPRTSSGALHCLERQGDVIAARQEFWKAELDFEG